jgi:hypothetical protein
MFMTQQRVIGSSEYGCDETTRRLKACSQISVMAYYTEPSWRVVLDPFEKRVAVTIGDRSFGDTDSGDEDMIDLSYRTSSTLCDLGVTLIESSHQLNPVIAQQPQEPAPHGAMPGEGA